MPLILNRRLQPLHGVIDLVPMVTVVLLLLCFFLLSSSFVLQPGIKVNPPRSEFSEGTPSSRLIVAVAMAPPQVDANGNALPPHPVLFFNDQIVTLDGFRRQLDQLPVGRSTPALLLNADRNVPLDVVTDIMNAAFAHRLSINLAMKPAGS
jgi:biopolymer transport protein ExbD